MPIPLPRIAPDAPLVQIQGMGAPAAQEGTEATPGATPPGSEEAEGAFGIFGMMISGLIILFAIVLLIRRSRRR